jgi:hypothetical protein
MTRDIMCAGLGWPTHTTIRKFNYADIILDEAVPNGILFFEHRNKPKSVLNQLRQQGLEACEITLV